MLGIFKKSMVNPPKELNSDASSLSSIKPKTPQDTLNHFLSSYLTNAISFSFSNNNNLPSTLAYAPAETPYPINRMFCCVDDIYCIFLGSLNNLCALNKQYGISKSANEAMYVIEAYRTLRDRGPYPAHEVLKDLDGSFGFLVYDSKAGSVFTAQGRDGRVKLYWGIGADESVVISDNLEVVKASCAKSYAPFPTGCMYHSEGGLMSYEHPTNKLKAMSRVDSEGVLCGSNFKVDVYNKTKSMPRVGSEANWDTWA